MYVSPVFEHTPPVVTGRRALVAAVFLGSVLLGGAGCSNGGNSDGSSHAAGRFDGYRFQVEYVPGTGSCERSGPRRSTFYRSTDGVTAALDVDSNGSIDGVRAKDEVWVRASVALPGSEGRGWISLAAKPGKDQAADEIALEHSAIGTTFAALVGSHDPPFRDVQKLEASGKTSPQPLSAIQPGFRPEDGTVSWSSVHGRTTKTVLSLAGQSEPGEPSRITTTHVGGGPSVVLPEIDRQSVMPIADLPAFATLRTQAQLNPDCRQLAPSFRLKLEACLKKMTASDQLGEWIARVGALEAPLPNKCSSS